MICSSVFASGGNGEGGTGGGGPGSKPGQVMLLKSVAGSTGGGPGSFAVIAGGDQGNIGSGGGPGIVLGEDVVDVRLENGDVYDVDYLKDKFGDWVKKEGTLLKLDTRIKIRDVQTAAGEIIAVQ